MEKARTSWREFWREMSEVPRFRDRAAYLLIWLLNASLWSLGAAAWLFRIGDSAIHGHILYSALWLLGGWIFTSVCIPTRCLITLYTWSIGSAFITFTPWGLKIALAEIQVAAYGLTGMVVWAIGTWLAEAVLHRTPSQTDGVAPNAEAWSAAAQAESKPSILSVILGVWIGMSLLTAALCCGDLFTITRGIGWREIWAERTDGVIFDSAAATLALGSAAWGQWRLRRMARPKP
ncbi:hypothetical protein CCAX7_56660 [Capsulimonas corticalis]|uniref:Uncharacterized protein n=1 Tax=Capsulimonas corticalis TaxID=2219043 RepID=A0A402D0I9_9BACT|nr:hypothetical protein [Capsulimonas corticalis]BDI33615.1 hypothetical protein CCAX7_56660 [Capsulimonas corticalis]